MYIYLQMIESPEDEIKFKHIFQNYKKHMHYVAYEILQNKYDVEDAVHNAFLSIAKNIKTVRCGNPAELHAFVTLVVKRKALDILDSNAKYISLEDDNPAYSYETSFPGDHGIADALAALPAHYRDLILMRYGEGLSTREIAKLMGFKQNTVQKWLKIAKDKLAEQLDKDATNI